MQGGASAWRVQDDLNRSQPSAMSHSADASYKMSDVELLAAYVETRRQFVERKFTRDTHRARLARLLPRATGESDLNDTPLSASSCCALPEQSAHQALRSGSRPHRGA